MASTALKAGAAVGAGYLLYRLARGTARLLWLLVKLAVQLPIALLNYQPARAPAPTVQPPVRRIGPPGPVSGRPPATPAAKPAPAAYPTELDLSKPEDRETLRRLIASGQVH